MIRQPAPMRRATSTTFGRTGQRFVRVWVADLVGYSRCVDVQTQRPGCRAQTQRPGCRAYGQGYDRQPSRVR
jgi:hypothetical protein